MKPCLACGEPIHADSMICCECGHLLPLRQEESRNPGAHPQQRSRKALASLMLGCVSFLLVPGLAAVVLGHWARGEIRKSRGALRGYKLASAGIILGYMGPLAVLVLAAVYGFPGRMLSPRAAKEDSAFYSMNVLNIALQAYAATYHQGFPEKLSQLGPSIGDNPLNADKSGFVAAELAEGNSDGYQFKYQVTERDPDGSPRAYTLTADPDASAAGEGSRYFYTDQTQVVRCSQQKPAGSRSPVFENDVDYSVPAVQ